MNFVPGLIYNIMQGAGDHKLKPPKGIFSPTNSRTDSFKISLSFHRLTEV